MPRTADNVTGKTNPIVCKAGENSTNPERSTSEPAQTIPTLASALNALSIEGSPGVSVESAIQDGYDKQNVAVPDLGSAADNPSEVNIIVSPMAGSKRKLPENNECRKKSKKNAVATDEGIYEKVNVPGDGSCLFWATALAYLFPVKYDNNAFRERYERLFGNVVSTEFKQIEELIRRHNPFGKVSIEDFCNNETFKTLVTVGFHDRVVNKISSYQKFEETITINDFYQCKNEEYVTGGTFLEKFRNVFSNEISEYNIDISKLRPSTLDEAAVKVCDSELGKIPNQDKVKKFKFNTYVDCMRSSQAWGGNHEIQAISQLLQCNVRVLSDNKPHLFEYDNSECYQIQLIHNGAVHYEFSLESAQMLFDNLSNNKQQQQIQPNQRNRTRTYLQESNDDERSSKTHKADVYKASGLKHSFHGNIYQLKHLVLFLIRGLEEGYSFRLATEMDSAEKFDDLVFEYKNGTNGLVYRFLQAKHKQDNSKEITINDLLTEKDDEFSLQKYFISFRRIKQNSDFKGELKDFIICTNIDLHEQLQDSFEPIEDEDYLLDGKKQSKRLRYKGGKFLEKEKLTTVFKKASDLNRLAKKFAEHVLSSHNGDGKLSSQVDLFKKYHGALAKDVIDIKTKQFKSDFISGSLCDEAMEFRKVLLKISKLSEDKFKDEMLNKKFIITDKFGKVLELQEDPEITSMDSKEFVNTIFDSTSGNKVSLYRTVPIIKSNIDKLAGHVLIEEDGIIKVRPGFLLNDIPKGLEEFRKEFIKKITDEKKDVDQLEFQINNFLTCTVPDYDEYEQDKSYFKHTLPNDEVSTDEINEFLDKLVFAVKQPNENELGNIIKQMLGDESNLMDSDLIAGKVLEDMLNWMKQKEGRFLTNEDGKACFDEVKQKLAKIKSSGATSLYRERIKEHGIAFSVIPTDLLRFLASSNENRIFNLANPYRTLLSAIKVDQALDSCQELYKKDDSHIFTSLHDLVILKQFFMKAFESSTNNLLIIECNPNPKAKDLQSLYGQLSRILKNNESKKIMFITEKDANYFEEDFFANSDPSNIKYKKIEDKNIMFNDITFDSQTELLTNRNVIFQGQEISLGELITRKNLCENQKWVTSSGGEILSKLINNEKIEIGKAPPGLGDVENFYIDRVFNRQIKINDNFINDSNFVITSSSNVRSNLQKDQDIILISDFSGGDFEEICNKYEKHNIHRLKKDGNEFIWQQSHGSLSKLREFVNTNKKSVLEYKTEKINDTVVIVSAEPGMGKSTVLTKLGQEAKKPDSSLWVVRVNLNDHTQVFAKTSFDNNIDKAVDFLLPILKFSGEPFENMLFEYRLKSQGKINLFFDGFDEISPSYKETVIELLYILKSTKVEKLWITTRPYMRCELEDRLSILSYTLKPLSRSNQETFLNRFWSKTLDSSTINEKRLSDYAEKLLDLFSKSIFQKEVEFASIPLQTRMLAEAFLNDCKQFHDSDLSTPNLPKKLNILDLYERFIETKYDIYCIEKNNQDTTKVGVSRDKRKLIKSFIKEHQQLAIYRLFGKNGLEKLFEESNSILEGDDSLIELIKQGYEKTGIIDRVSADNIPIFVHQTYAEYFAALLLANNVNRKKVKHFIREQIFEEQNKVIRYFFDRMLSKDENKCKLHVAVLNDDLDTVEELLSDPQTSKDLLNTTDEGGRTALHLAATYDSMKIGYILLARGTDINIIDHIFKWTALSYAVKKGQWGLANSILGKGANGDDMFETTVAYGQKKETLLHKAAQSDFSNLVKVLVKGKCGNDLDAVLEAKDIFEKTPLHRAAEYGNFEVVQFLVENGANLNCKDTCGATPLHYAAKHRKINVVQRLVRRCKDVNRFEIVNDPDNDGNTPLHLAVAYGHFDVMKILVENRADVNARNKHLQTPLHKAAVIGKLTFIEFLVKNGADVNAQDKNSKTLIDLVNVNSKPGVKNFLENFKNKTSRTPLHLAAENGLLEEVQLIVEKGGDVNDKDFEGDTALHIATANGSFDVAKFLVEKGADINVENKKLLRPLHMATRYNKLVLVEFLITKGALVNAKSNDSKTPLHYAAAHAHLDVVKCFVGKEGVDVNDKDSAGNTPLMLAAARGKLDVIEFLITNDASVNDKNTLLQTPLYLAAATGKIDVIKFLVQKGASVKVKDHLSKTPLHSAAAIGSLEVVKFLVGKSVAVNDEDKEGKIPLHYAVVINNIHVVEFLIENGANVDAKDEHFKRPLHYAASNANLRVVKCFAGKDGVDVNAKDKDGNTPLMLAAARGKLDVIEFLVTNGAYVNDENTYSQTPLYLAAATGKIVVIKFLVKKGASVKVKDKHSKTPLHSAAAIGSLEVVKFLVLASVAVNDVDIEGKIPLHYAVVSNNIHVVKFLVENGANVNAKDQHLKTPLHLAAVSGKLEVVKFLVGKIDDVDDKDKEGKTPLQCAAENGYLDVANFLLKEGTNPKYLEAR